MKKLLLLALFAALSFSAIACSDSDSCPSNLLVVDLMADLNSVGPQATSAEGSTVSYVKAIDTNDVESAVADCENFITSLGTIVDKNKDITTDTLTSDWAQYKDADWVCKGTLALVIAVQSVRFAINYKTIKENIQVCSGGAIAIGAESIAKLKEQSQTLDGWASILDQAATVTANVSTATGN